jgi:hypothetical protein
MSIVNLKELEPYQRPSSVRFSTQNFFRIWVFEFFGVWPYLWQIGVFLSGEKFLIELGGPISAMEAS